MMRLFQTGALRVGVPQMWGTPTRSSAGEMKNAPEYYFGNFDFTIFLRIW